MHQHTREGNSLKPTKFYSFVNGLWLLKYAGRLAPKNDSKLEYKNSHKRKISHKIKGNAERLIVFSVLCSCNMRDLPEVTLGSGMGDNTSDQEADKSPSDVSLGHSGSHMLLPNPSKCSTICIYMGLSAMMSTGIVAPCCFPLITSIYSILKKK